MLSRSRLVGSFSGLVLGNTLVAPNCGVRAELGSKKLAKVNSPWPHPRLLIALHSPTASSKPDCASAFWRKVGTLTSLNPEQSVLSSPLCQGISQNTGMFRVFRGKGSGISLQSRLRGGGRGIRTLGTVWKRARADICVSCTESTSSEILR